MFENGKSDVVSLLYARRENRCKRRGGCLMKAVRASPNPHLVVTGAFLTATVPTAL